MCTRGQLKRDRKPRRKLVSSGLRKIFQTQRYADKKNISVFKRLGKKDISEMPTQQNSRTYSNNFVPKGNSSARRRSLLGARK